MWRVIKKQSGAALTLVLLAAAAVLIVIALSHSNKLKVLATIDLLPI